MEHRMIFAERTTNYYVQWRHLAKTQANERMIQKKVLGTPIKQRRITGRNYSRTSSSTVLIALLLAGLFSIKVISSCVISPSEAVAFAGDLSSFSCNARPNNQTAASIVFIKLGSDGASGTDIFRPPSYGQGGRIINKLFLADGYFVSHLDDSHSNVTIQINETQLKHGGQYFCTCVESTSPMGTANLTVLDKLSFVRSGDEALTPGTMVDLTCLVSFNGSTSSAFIDLIINDANCTEVSSKRNLSLTKNVAGHHAINYKVIADSKEEQRFTCEVKVWNKSPAEMRPLHSLKSHFSLKWDLITTPPHYSMSTAPQMTARTTFIAGFAGGVFTGVLVTVAVIFIFKKCRTQIGKRSPIASQDIYEDANLSIEHPPRMKPQNSAGPHYETIDKEKRIVESNQTAYEELNLNDHSIQTGQYIDVIP